MTNPVDPIYFLLVDDLDENLVSLEALLRREGLVILTARTGPQALEILLTHEVALALVDVQMPGMDGFELAELMRGTERTRRVPIIFVTAGENDLRRRFRGYEAGAVDFLQKPIEPDVLRSKADVFFELSLQRQRLQIKVDENARLLEDSVRYAEALKAADRHKDEFLATLSHELRNPLAPIRTGLTLLRSAPELADTEKLLEIMDRQLDHLVRLVDDLMDVSRVSRGKIDLRIERIKLQDAVRAAIEASQPFIDAANHEFTFNLPEEDVWLDADLTRLAQILSNLLNNAARYTPPGGKICLTATASSEQVEITILDNGRGIPPDMLSRIFDLFTQVDRKMETPQEGLGIGLALARKLASMHGGDVMAASEGLGHGSRFTVRLPRVGDQPQTGTKHSST